MIRWSSVRRRLLNFLTAVSLLLLVAVCVVWVRSYWVEDQVMWRRVDGARWVVSSPGAVVVGVERANWSGWPAEGFGLRYERGTPAPVVEHVVRMLVLNVGPGDTFEQWAREGFGWYRWRPASGASMFLRVVVPTWFLAAASALLPAARLVRRVVRRRARGVCARCGYDLRATPERCPECGEIAGTGAGA